VKYEPFIYGKDQTEGVVSIEIDGPKATLYTENGETVHLQNLFYILYDNNYTGDLIRLDGSLHYKWVQKFDDKQEHNKAIAIAKSMGWSYYTIYNPKESFMVRSGVTYYKGLKPEDVSILSFDIETTGLSPATNQVLMISNTYRSRGKTIRKLFSIDEFNSEKEMIYAWCNFVVDHNPSVLLGHNVFGFDLPFLKHRLGKELPIGRLRARAKTARYSSQFRKDGSQSYDYTNVLVPGREIIDTFHLAIKYDFKRKYPSYGLKAIIAHEGLEKENRQHFDASKIGQVYKIMSEYPDGSEINFQMTLAWDKIKKYAEHDADDSLALYDLMVPAFFYYCQHIPKTMQQIINSATGAQVNSFMVRAYLSEGHSLPMASDRVDYEGAISFGHPGIYKYVAKVDVASMYPSIILQHDVYDKDKDPKKYFIKMVDYFTTERLKNKQMSAKTGDRYYEDLEQAQKIVINSAYGFMGAPGLLFNSPRSAAIITKWGRTYLQRGIYWADRKQWTIVNADTDSFCFSTGNKFPPGAFKEWIKELNEIFPEMIRWEDDGMYSKVIVVKAKNYLLQNGKDGKITIKGSALKATMKEPALKEFMSEVLNTLLEEQNERLGTIYKDYVRRIHTIDGNSISLWASKKTITKSVLNPQRTNEARIKEAVQRAKKAVSEGDKIHVFFRDNKSLALVESFDGVYCIKKMLGKLFKTAEILKSVVDMDSFPNLTLKRNQEILNEIKMTTPQQAGDLPEARSQTNI
jgi:DNA polymerase elongation subunit (family B)